MSCSAMLHKDKSNYTSECLLGNLKGLTNEIESDIRCNDRRKDTKVQEGKFSLHER